MPRRSPIDVFEYLDFRAFLADVYAHRKAQGRGFSYRVFARLAGLRSPNHLKRVIDGERNLSPGSAIRYAEALGLEGDAAAYFSDLVTFNQAKTSTVRNAAYERLTGFRSYRKVQALDLAHAAYHAEWYIPAIRELAARSDFCADPAWIARRMVPAITLGQAGRALDTLLSLGLLVEDADGHVGQGEAILSTGSQTRGMHIATYHRAMLKKAMESIDVVAAPNRDVSSLTFAIGEDGLRRLKDRIQRFQQEIIALASREDDPEQVVQLNFQLFPLSTQRSDEEPS